MRGLPPDFGRGLSGPASERFAKVRDIVEPHRQTDVVDAVGGLQIFDRQRTIDVVQAADRIIGSTPAFSQASTLPALKYPVSASRCSTSPRAPGNASIFSSIGLTWFLSLGGWTTSVATSIRLRTA